MSTRVGMPTHYEMLVSHSPPLFSHSPPTGFLSDYSTNNRLYDPSRFCRPHVLTLQNRQRAQLTPVTINMPSIPKRGCLVVKPEQNHISNGNSTELNHSKTKKKVVFADDQGHSLTEIRVMSEPSNVPPLWSLKFLAHVTQGLISPVPPEQWTVTFRQPASDYLDFRRRLDLKNISLENVIVKENESIVVGTVKVRNLGFHKEVFVRTSWDAWKSQEDTFCIYSQVGGASGAYVLYDTFSFKLTLPPLSKKLEFCVCFRCNGTEYWDNNDGKNYEIYKKITNDSGTDNVLRNLENKFNGNLNSNGQINAQSSPINIPQKYTDSTQAKLTSWSEFASWSHLENSCPYW